MNTMSKTYVSPSWSLMELDIICSDIPGSINQGPIDKFERDDDIIEGF